MGEEEESGDQSHAEGRSSRGLICGGASVSLAEVGCGRYEGVKNETGDIIRDQSLWGLMRLSKEGILYPVLVSSRKIFKQEVNMISSAY